jgi:hypothetical protein
MLANQRILSILSALEHPMTRARAGFAVSRFFVLDRSVRYETSVHERSAGVSETLMISGRVSDSYGAALAIVTKHPARLKKPEKICHRESCDRFEPVPPLAAGRGAVDGLR